MGKYFSLSCLYAIWGIGFYLLTEILLFSEALRIIRGIKITPGLKFPKGTIKSPIQVKNICACRQNHNEILNEMYLFN